MILKDLITVLNDLAPIHFSESWDNPGLLAGDENKEIGKVYIALDATSEVIEEAHRQGADLILTHHPLIFKPLNRISSDHYVGKRIMKIIAYDMALFAMHTDFDVTCMGAEAAEKLGLIESKVLEPTVSEEYGIGMFGYLKEDLKLTELADKVKNDFGIESVRVYGDPEETIVKVAVLPGSGASGIDAAFIEGCDVLITGDISHHNGIDALEKGVNVIDAGHYGIEKLFIGYMSEYIKSNTPSVEVVEDKTGDKSWLR
ncbi:MAG: Nif3-like dinuclear metal center hexameric protein [Lachnospiraceae bacterium]|nr:Nif3-like dinuclear metal center hexameric protein [Lachnospiraceae bacterium]